MSEVNVEIPTPPVQPKKKNKLIPIIIVVAVLLAAAIAGAFYYKQEQERKAAEEYALKLKEYEKQLDAFVLGAYTAGSTAETIIGTYVSVWHAAIWEDFGVKIGDEWYYDFNDALTAQYILFDETGLLDTFDETFDLVSDSMDKLYDPPKEFEREFDAVEDVYDSLNELVSLAKNPNGSLQTFSADGNAKSSKVASDLQKLEKLLK